MFTESVPPHSGGRSFRETSTKIKTVTRSPNNVSGLIEPSPTDLGKVPDGKKKWPKNQTTRK